MKPGRLGLRSIANELNPVAAIILRATCQWPQKYGYELLDSYSAVSTRFRQRVNELLEGVYPTEPQLSEAEKLKEFKTTRAHRYVWSYLWARVVFCPSCKGRIPLSPNWRLTSEGTGHPASTGRGEWRVRLRDSQQASPINPPALSKNAIATCPYPNCGATTPRELHLPGSSGRSIGPPALLRHLPGPVVAPHKVRQAQEAAQDQARLPNSHSKGRQFFLGCPMAEGTQTAVGRCRCPSQ